MLATLTPAAGLLATSTLWLGIRLIFSLAIVLGLIMALSWAVRRGKGLGLGLGVQKGAISVRPESSWVATPPSPSLRSVTGSC